MKRQGVVVSAILVLVLAVAPLRVRASGSAPPATRNVVLITVDGLRVQELFGGLDPNIIAGGPEAGIEFLERVLTDYWMPTSSERREVLMPFFWGELAPGGMVFGNPDLGCRVRLRNPHRFSYPGYAEILTGRHQELVDSNEYVRSPATTVLEHTRERLGLGFHDVAVIASWDNFAWMASRQEDAFFVNAGYAPVPPEVADEGMRLLSEIQAGLLTRYETSRSDVITYRIAKRYLLKYRPRLLYIALGESDDWAHARRYDKVLDWARVFDGFLRDLWSTLQGIDAYAGRTSLVITTDHGRGRRPANWTGHGAGTDGAEDVWVAVVGPDTPALGEVEGCATVHLADVASTVLQLLGLDSGEYDPRAGPPLPGVFAPGARDR